MTTERAAPIMMTRAIPIDGQPVNEKSKKMFLRKPSLGRVAVFAFYLDSYYKSEDM